MNISKANIIENIANFGIIFYTLLGIFIGNIGNILDLLKMFVGNILCYIRGEWKLLEYCKMNYTVKNYF